MNQAHGNQPTTDPSSTDTGTAGSEPSRAKDKVSLLRRGWFRATCAIAPFVAVVLIASAASDHSPSPSSTSTTLAGAVPGAAAPSGAAGGAATRPAAAPTAHRSATPGASVASGAGAVNGTSSGGQADASANPAAVSAWGSAHAELLRTLHNDVTNLDADAANQELSSLVGDCGRLQTDLPLAQSAPPVPDPSVESLWNEALGDFSRAILECVGGVGDHDVSKISEAAQDTSSGEATLTALASRMGVPSAS